jgi:hypothetical protein
MSLALHTKLIGLTALEWLTFGRSNTSVACKLSMTFAIAALSELSWQIRQRWRMSSAIALLIAVTVMLSHLMNLKFGLNDWFERSLLVQQNLATFTSFKYGDKMTTETSLL